MLKRAPGGLFALALLIGLNSTARAQNVLSVTQPSGTGGTGATAIDTQYENYGINSLLDVYLDFTKVAPISFSFDVNSAGGYTLHANSGFNPNFTTGIVNDTGHAWGGFIFSVDTSNGAGPNGLQIGNYFTQSTFTPSQIILSGGVVPPGGTFDVIFGAGTPVGGTIDVTFTPQVATPEPSTLVLLAAAALCAPVVYWRHRRRSRIAALAAAR